MPMRIFLRPVPSWLQAKCERHVRKNMRALAARRFSLMLPALLAQAARFFHPLTLTHGVASVNVPPVEGGAKMDAQIRYLAIVSERPDMLARFYSTYFAMRELGRSDAGDIALTDGFYNISILKPRDGATEVGISHFGIAIDGIGEIEARLKDFAPTAELCQEEGGLCRGDYR